MQNKRTLRIDIETYSSVDIRTSGSYKYTQSKDFEILLFAYAFDGEDAKIIDLAQGEQLPEEVIVALSDPNIIKNAYNAVFEWYCLNRFWKTPLDQWQCTMVKRFILWLSCWAVCNRKRDRFRRG